MENKCSTCVKNRTPSSVPYSVYEMREQSNRKTITKLWVALIIAWLSVLLVVGIFTYERLQYDYVGETTSYEVQQNAEDGGNANYVGNNVEVGNGISKGKND